MYRYTGRGVVGHYIDRRISAHKNKTQFNMEKTVLVIAANSLCGEPCGQPLAFDLSLGKSKASNASKVSRLPAYNAILGAVPIHGRG